MKRMITGIGMLVYYWVAVYLLQEGTIIDDYMDQPLYMSFGEGFLSICIILVIAVNFLIAMGIAFHAAGEYAADYEFYDYDEYEYRRRDAGCFGTVFAVAFGLHIVEAGILFGLDYLFHLGEFGESALYLDNRPAWNIGFMIVYNIVACVLFATGVIAFIKRVKMWHQHRIILKQERKQEKEIERKVAEQVRLEAERIKMEKKSLIWRGLS